MKKESIYSDKDVSFFKLPELDLSTTELNNKIKKIENEINPSEEE